MPAGGLEGVFWGVGLFGFQGGRGGVREFPEGRKKINVLLEFPIWESNGCIK